MSTAEQDTLGGGTSTPSASFREIGASYTGRIKAVDKRQDEDVHGNRKVWGQDKRPTNATENDTRDPVLVYIITLDTPQGDIAVWARAQMLVSIRSAIQEGGCRTWGDAVGGTLTVKFAQEGEQKKKGYNKPKLYTASFEPAAGTASGSVVDEDIPF